MKPLLDEITELFTTQTFSNQRDAAQAAIDVVERRLLSDETIKKIISDAPHLQLVTEALVIAVWQAVKEGTE
jgi:hypothetical protein